MTCEYCHTLPHLPGCPGEPEPRAVHRCKRCKEGITEGEEFYDIDGEYYHVECLEEMTVAEILSLLGIDKEEA
ncbi:hypothetical protein IMSAG049_01064 [Clostridiales bacterium]|nr:hypothetical protein IMSAG049_01064 [Clostridiales bacterium]